MKAAARASQVVGGYWLVGQAGRGVDPGDEAVSPAVGVVGYQHPFARPQLPEQRVNGSHPAGEGQTAGGAFQCRQALLQSSACRVGGTGVVVPQVLPDPRLGVRRGLEDRGDHGARTGVGWLTGVNGQRLEPHGPRT